MYAILNLKAFYFTIHEKCDGILSTKCVFKMEKTLFTLKNVLHLKVFDIHCFLLKSIKNKPIVSFQLKVYDSSQNSPGKATM